VGDVNDELSRRLIDEAARLLAEEGPAGLSVRKLASAAGTSTMAIYSRFGDKPSLLAAMHREGFRRLGAHLQVTATDPETALVELGRAYRRSALQSPHLYALMFGPRPPGFRPGEDDDKAADARMRRSSRLCVPPCRTVCSTATRNALPDNYGLSPMAW
jgi:AcrR family transcriptional regulator